MNNEYLLTVKTGHLVQWLSVQKKKIMYISIVDIVDYFKSGINVGLSVTIRYTESTLQAFKSSNLTMWTFWRQNMATIEP